MADYTGGAGNDTYAGTNQADTIYGGDGNDTLGTDSPANTGNGSDTIYGEGGDDTLYGGNGNDTLVGGADNDTLKGGNGNDTFVFNFTINPGGSWQTREAVFRDGNSPAEMADAVAWNNYLKQLAVWRAEMTTLYGTDENQNLDGTAYLTTSTKKAGAIMIGEVSYDNDFQYQEWVDSSSIAIQGEGYDTVLDWGNGADVLVLSGLSDDSTASNYWGNWLTADTATDGKTVISFEGGSITLIGVDTTIEALIAAGSVSWG